MQQGTSAQRTQIMNLAEFKSMVIAEYSNQKKHDKHSIAYTMHSIDYNNYGMLLQCYDTISRKELLQKFAECLESSKAIKNLLNLQPYRNISIIEL